MPRQRKDFYWRYQPPLNSLNAALLRYLQDSENYSGQNINKTEMILKALTAFYLPLVCSKYEILTENDLKKVARDCISALLLQIERIKAELEIYEDSDSKEVTIIKAEIQQQDYQNLPDDLGFHYEEEYATNTSN
jgi:hypothetical protein